MKIKVILTGGTFDKSYNPISGCLEFKESVLDEFISLARIDTSRIKIEQPFLIDSLEMEDSHRYNILETCQNSKETQILITHGTDTMVETAQFLESKLQGGQLDKLNKTIVLIGAMIPARISNSDAFFNLGFGFATVQILGPGVYIAIQGQIFKPQEVEKNVKQGLFIKKAHL